MTEDRIQDVTNSDDAEDRVEAPTEIEDLTEDHDAARATTSHHFATEIEC